MIDSKNIDVDSLQENLVNLLDTEHIRYNTSDQKKGRLYSIQSKDVALEICIGPSWIGSSISLDLSGRRVEFDSDTDNYPLNGEFKKHALEIYEDILTCIKAFVNGEIYGGLRKSKATIIVPLSKGGYMYSSQGRIFGSSKYVNKINAQLLENLKPLTYRS